MASVYVASPLGFSEAGRLFYYSSLIPKLKALGLQVLDPWTLTEQWKLDAVSNMPYGPDKRDAWRRLNIEIGSNNKSAIDKSDLVLAVLDGSDVDSGTASEIGYASALGKLVLGYRSDFRLSSDNDGSVVNLQVEFFIFSSGGEIISSLDQIPDAIGRTSHAV